MTGLPSSLPAFLDRFKGAIAEAVIGTYPPRYGPHMRRALGFDELLRSLKRRPLGAQADIARALAMELRDGRSAFLVAEMGTGKSFCAIAAAYLAGKKRVLVIAPPHLTVKWKREIETTIRWTVPPAIVRTPAQLDAALRQAAFTPSLWVIVPDTAAKLGSGWRPAAVTRRVGGISVYACPDCGAPVTDTEGNPLTLAELGRRKHRCTAPVRTWREDARGHLEERTRLCGAALWCTDAKNVGEASFGAGIRGKGPRRVPLAEYVRRRHPGVFDLLVADECHQYKGKGSAQGFAAGTLARACGQTLSLTGTLMSGYASSLFYLLHRFSPPVRREFRWSDEARWVQRYGRVERVTHKDGDEVLEDGAASRRKAYRTTVIEKPGVAPMVLFHLIGSTVFARLADVADGLPPYQEHVSVIPLDEQPVFGAFQEGAPIETSQARAYGELSSALHERLLQLLSCGSKRLLGAYLQTLLSYPDGCTREELVHDPANDDLVAAAPALPEDRLYPKEQRLVELCTSEKALSRRTLVYVTNTEKRDVTPRLRTVLERHGLRVAVLKSSTVASEARESWVREQVERQNVDVLLVHPKLVATGLDLLWFPTICWFQLDYSTFTVRQASRRSWRIGQRQPVHVHYLVYGGTLQAKALHLVATKMQAALAVEGDLAEDGLAGLEAEDDFFVALARQTVVDGEFHAGGLESLFASAGTGEADEYLVTDPCDDEGDEPESVWVDPAAMTEPVLAPGPTAVLSFDEFVQRMGVPGVVTRRRRAAAPAPGQLSLFG